MTPAEAKNIELRRYAVGECEQWRSDAKSETRRRHPQTTCDGEPVLVRRMLFEIETGRKLTDAECVVPTCLNPYCIKPEHQKVITRAQHQKSAAKRGAKSPTRAAKVAATKRARGLLKLTDEQVCEIRASDASGPELAARMNCSVSMVSLIRLNKVRREYAGNPFAGLLGGARA